MLTIIIEESSRRDLNMIYKLKLPRISASSIECVLKIIVLSFLYLNKSSQILLLPLGSTPALGSSRMTVFEPNFK